MMGDRTAGLETVALSKIQTYTHIPLLSIVKQPTEEQVGRRVGRQSARGPGCLARWRSAASLSAGVQPSSLQFHWAGHTPVQICRWYTLAIQLLLGFAAPVLYWGCSDVMAGVRYAREHNIDDSDRLHRLYRWLCRYVCPGHIAMFGIMAAAAAILALASAGLLMRGGA